MRLPDSTLFVAYRCQVGFSTVWIDTRSFGQSYDRTKELAEERSRSDPQLARNHPVVHIGEVQIVSPEMPRKLSEVER